MQFNSYIFVFGFLPLTLAGFYALARCHSLRLGHLWLIFASIAFYAWWNAEFVALLLGSVAFNYGIGRLIEAYRIGNRPRGACCALTFGIVANLAMLGIFKYLVFFVTNWNALSGSDIVLGNIILPLGISFFTFEQIAYLVDAKRSGQAEHDALHYALFVVFFPRLVAGPILRASEIIPQLRSRLLNSVPLDSVAVGLTLFSIGLFKKAFLADGIAPYATTVFAAAARGEHVDMLLAWGGALAYTCQLYFDFSGYSDMAIGLARCFGIQFPVNFLSPYKATNIVEFWRCWHMTLSRFLRDYLYIPLGGNRYSKLRRYFNLMTTMILGGFWHGASWTFMAWGALHGVYLCVNHLWALLRQIHPRLDSFHMTRTGALFSWLLTFLAVIVGWVFFRAPNFAAAVVLLHGMIGGEGIIIPTGVAFLFGSHLHLLGILHIHFGDGSGTGLVMTYLWIAGLMAISLLLPNVQQILPLVNSAVDPLSQAGGRFDRTLLWKTSWPWAFGIATLALTGILSISRVSEFLYWRF